MHERTVFQMYIDNKKIYEALQFKDEHFDKKGRCLDLLSYGSLIEYFGSHSNVDKAIEALKECIDKHGSPPAEKCLSKLRLLSRQKKSEDLDELEDLIGPDPLAWLREGENKLKREYSKKGRKNIHYIRNRLTNI